MKNKYWHQPEDADDKVEESIRTGSIRLDYHDACALLNRITNELAEEKERNTQAVKVIGELRMDAVRMGTAIMTREGERDEARKEINELCVQLNSVLKNNNAKWDHGNNSYASTFENLINNLKSDTLAAETRCKEIRQIGKQFEEDSRKHFEQSFINLNRAIAAEDVLREFLKSLEMSMSEEALQALHKADLFVKAKQLSCSTVQNL